MLKSVLYVKTVKVKEALKLKNAVFVKVKVLLIKWFNQALECIHKLNVIAVNVKVLEK